MSSRYPIPGTPMTPSEYAEEWATNSSYFKDKGHYRWMKDQLGNARKIIEIGSGSGFSTQVLENGGNHVISIENNPDSSESSMRYLLAEGVNVSRHSADEFASLCSETSLDGVAALNCNVFELESEPWDKPAVDAIVCWLVGSDPFTIMKSFKKEMSDFCIEVIPLYREKIQRFCYELGKRVLRPHGVVHIVDRYVISSWQDKSLARSDTAEVHLALSGGGYQIETDDVYLRRLEYSFADSNIQYIASGIGDGGLPVLLSCRATFLGGEKS